MSRKKKTDDLIPVGVAWYDTQEDWASIKSTAMDPERFENTYDEWKSMAENVMVKMRETGILPVKVILTPEDFSTWCFIYNKENCAESRADFAGLKIRDNSKRKQQA